MQMDDKLDYLGLGFILYGGLQVLAALFIGLVYGLSGLAMTLGGLVESDAGLAGGGVVFVVLAVLIGLFVLVMGAAYAAVGMGLRARRSWSRVGGMIAGALGLMSMPIGTLLGVSAFVVLLDDEAKRELTR